jgi:hypothetical protein
MLDKLQAQIAEQNRLVVEKGGTAVSTEYLEKDIRVGFNQKLVHLHTARRAAIHAQEDLEKTRDEFDAMRVQKEVAEARNVELEALADSARAQVGRDACGATRQSNHCRDSNRCACMHQQIDQLTSHIEELRR